MFLGFTGVWNGQWGQATHCSPSFSVNVQTFDAGAAGAEVNISSYPARILAGLFFFCRAEILNSGGFVQKYSDQGVSCKNIGQ